MKERIENIKTFAAKNIRHEQFLCAHGQRDRVYASSTGFLWSTEEWANQVGVRSRGVERRAGTGATQLFKFATKPEPPRLSSSIRLEAGVYVFLP